MAVQPNLVLGAVGLAIALLTGAYIVDQWEPLTGLRDYEVDFSNHSKRFEPRDGVVAANGQRDEVYRFENANVTVLHLYLTWQDPITGAPEVRLEAFDPAGRNRSSQRHQGGTSGIRFDLELIDETAIPTGHHSFQARGHDRALGVLEDRWPTHTDGQGNWTMRIKSTTTSGPASATAYTLRVEYGWYEGRMRETPTPEK